MDLVPSTEAEERLQPAPDTGRRWRPPRRGLAAGYRGRPASPLSARPDTPWRRSWPIERPSLHSPVNPAFDQCMPLYAHRQLAVADILLPHQAADFIGMPETALWLLMRARRFPLPGLICSASRVARLCQSGSGARSRRGSGRAPRGCNGHNEKLMASRRP